METAKQLRAGDEWYSQWEANHDDALKECIALAGEITLAVEHLITEETSAVEQRNITELHTAVKKIADLQIYDYTAIVEGKYQVYEKKFEYDFTKQLMEFLDDALGYNYEELFV